MKSKTYHNTTNQNGTFVKIEINRFKNQENEVMSILIQHKQLTASEVWKWFSKDVPLTSIRRALSNLAYDKHITKTEDTKIGLYGKPEHYYEVFDLDKLF
jgi:predicted transcriptional regulator